MKTIICSCGQPILVDDGSFEGLNRFKWFCHKGVVFRTIKSTKGPVCFSLASELIEIPLGCEPDHKDRNGHNNLRSNLRVATKSQNKANRSMPKNNTTGFKGVGFYLRPLPFQGRIIKDGKYYSKCFATIEEAARWYDCKAIELNGEFAFTNFPRNEYEQLSNGRVLYAPNKNI